MPLWERTWARQPFAPVPNLARKAVNRGEKLSRPGPLPPGWQGDAALGAHLGATAFRASPDSGAPARSCRGRVRSHLAGKAMPLWERTWARQPFAPVPNLARQPV